MLVPVLVLVSLALCVTLAIALFGSRAHSSSSLTLQKRLDAEVKARSLADAELDRRRKEVEEQRAALAETREQLKQAKRKLFENKEVVRGDRDLARAREEIERTASAQLSAVQSDLSHALAEIQRLKAESDPSRSRRSAPAPAAPAPPTPHPAAAPAEKPVRVVRELSEADRERIQRLEQQATREHARSTELDRELRRMRGKMETQHRIYVVTKGELDLVKDKFKALEKRLNRTLLERDLIRRAIASLESKTGIHADRTELTADEIAASDRKIDEKLVAEAREVAAAHVRAEPPAKSGQPTGTESSEATANQGAETAS